MDRTKTLAAVGLILLAACSGPAPLRVGSKNFTESVILGEIIAQHLEHRLHRPVERRLNLGGTLLAHEALRSGAIALYPEYTGTALTAILKQQNGPDVLQRVREAYQRDFHIAWLDPLGVDDTFAMVVRGQDARQLGLETLSQAAQVQKPWVLGAGYEFEQRPDGLRALNMAYGLPWQGKPKYMDLGLLYKALEQGQVTMIAANSTDGLLSKLDLKMLADDKHSFPPYEICIAAHEDALRATPGLREALAELAGKFTNAKMQQLNYQVDGEHRPVAEVAKAFLASLTN